MPTFDPAAWQQAASVEPAAPAKPEQIRRAALKVFLENGYANTSIDMILAEAVVSRQTLYRYFKGKEPLFLGVVAGILNEVLTAITDAVREADLEHSDDLEADLAQVGRAFMRIMLQPEVLALRRLVIGEAARLPHLAAAWDEHGPGQVRTILEPCFRALAARGLMTLDKDPQLTVAFYARTMIIPVEIAMLNVDFAPGQDVIETYIRGGVKMFLARYATK
ncbi:TetR/AcrR family transcriptional regulator [Actinospica durhamensis]|uniref:TetR/AcrR family transcriptional regulator n=1 Tax=Actinospica durhamensis TaxID=1508375 RepID=A0A941EY93_9ACTN|nr:TetR/AcrR family transcriptional regulator [Actinospica durhamensis]MBR7839618.1 TetR/AcrR family transcriptional regulator [Actinospica durhamensis]